MKEVEKATFVRKSGRQLEIKFWFKKEIEKSPKKVFGNWKKTTLVTKARKEKCSLSFKLFLFFFSLICIL